MLSIIIPVLNEAETIVSVLTHLEKSISQMNAIEVVVVDGGSVDGTQQLIQQHDKSREAERLPNADASGRSTFEIVLITSEKGRAKQMNKGAEIARGAILYFLHADSFPPNHFDTLILSEVEKGNLAGCFKMKFDSAHWWLQLASWLTQFSWRACRGGDQSQFVSKELFYEIGGFDENYVIYEDNILINELYARNQFVVIQKWLDTSARLYREKGVWNLQYHFWAIYVKKWFGADADQLYAYYCKHIKSSKSAAPFSKGYLRKVLTNK